MKRERRFAEEEGNDGVDAATEAPLGQAHGSLFSITEPGAQCLSEPARRRPNGLFEDGEGIEDAEEASRMVRVRGLGLNTRGIWLVL